MKRKIVPVILASLVISAMTACEMVPITFESATPAPEITEVASEVLPEATPTPEPTAEPTPEASEEPSEDLSGITDKFTLLLKGGIALGKIEMKDYSDCESQLLDIDRDNEDELFLRTDDKTSYLIDLKDDHLSIKYEGDGNTKPIVEGKYCGLMNYREGGFPYHETYKYTSFDYDGNVFEETSIEWYDMNDNAEMDKADQYLMYYDDFTEIVKTDKWIKEYGELAADIKEYFNK